MASDIPSSIRLAVHERDQGTCRLCGSFATAPHLHHVQYRSQGGRHVVENLVTLHFGCHDVVHSDKGLWQPILMACVARGVNGYQLLRWARAAEKSRASK